MASSSVLKWRHIWTIFLLTVVHRVCSENANLFVFTQEEYHVTIYENSIGQTYVEPMEKMGIYFANEKWDVKYKILQGREDKKFFKAEARTIGDFCFLRIRTRTGIFDVLNREYKDTYVLTVRAMVRSRLDLETTTKVIVTVLDSNDLNPVFYDDDRNVHISEDTALHQSIFQVRASDADLGINGEIYYSFKEWTTAFAIHPTTGVVTVTHPLNYAQKHLYELTVIAKDRGPKFRVGDVSKPSSVKLKITVTQANLHSPRILVDHLPTVLEHSSSGIIYAIVKVYDEDQGIHGEIKSLEIIEGDPDRLFTVRPGTQPKEFNIQVIKVLDRESAPYGYNLTLLATDNGYPARSTTQVVNVKLMDQNDHSPQFEQSSYKANVLETVLVNTSVVLVHADDQDWGKNADVKYKIIGGNENAAFKINSVTGLIYVALPLDFETKATYSLTVEAEDQGNVGMRKQNTTTVHITVLDYNDNSPKFTRTNPVAYIRENEPTGTFVYQVEAEDKDAGENGYVSYRIVNLNEVPFVIDHFNGSIYSTKPLDFEINRKVFKIAVRASDWGMPYRRESELMLTVNVQDQNDNIPRFEKANCSGYVIRSAPLGTEITVMSAIDFDAGDIVSYGVDALDQDTCFTVDEMTGIVRLNCNLKKTQKMFTEVRIIASDGVHTSPAEVIKIDIIDNDPSHKLADGLTKIKCADPGVRTAFTEMMIKSNKNNEEQKTFGETLPDRYGINKNYPVFKSTIPDVIEVMENSPVGSNILQLSADDNDLGYNGKLVYVISDGNIDSCFDINPETGELHILSALNREKTSRYNLNISVSDLGLPPKSAYRSLTIVVKDVNDCMPVFDKYIYEAMISEAVTNGTSIVQVSASDCDQRENAMITYSFSTDIDDFHIDSRTGEITVFGELDREKQEKYELHVKATDSSAAEPLWSENLVIIILLDVNDNVPTFLLPLYNMKVREDLPVGSVIGTVSASDSDLGSDGTVRYSIVQGNRQKFDLDTITGVIRVREELDFEKTQIYNLTVRATDRGRPPLSSSVEVIIEIVDVNENLYTPQFSDFALEGEVMENQPIGTKVMVVTAIDEDDVHGTNGIMYSIRDGSGMRRFTIDNKGVIRTADILDRETVSHYWLTVVAQDRSAVPLHSIVHVYIKVLDINDNAPQTTEPVYRAGIPENGPAGVKVVQLSAFDLDEGESGAITYKLLNNFQFFKIDSATGLITTRKTALDREIRDEHVIDVRVTDNGHPPLSSTTRVVVTVNDTNDNKPQFIEKIYKVQLPASSSRDTPLMRVIAVDPDVGRNGEISYSLKTTSRRGRSRFNIDSKMGMIYSRKGLVAGEGYDITVKAVDRGQPPLKNSVRVLIHVLEQSRKSDHAPVIIENPNITTTVMENDPPGTLIKLVDAFDEDGDRLWYSVTDGDDEGMFSIDVSSGSIILARRLNWKIRDWYNLTIAVTDGFHSVSSSVFIKVIDVNDHSPQFSQDVYVVSLAENSRAGASILTVHASDDDDENRLHYSLSDAMNILSLSKFAIESSTGVVTVAEPLDREAIAQHILTVTVKDKGVPPRRDFARLILDIVDSNDHPPHFISEMFEGRVFETAAVGTSVVQVLATDKDKGLNAEITYKIETGNVEETFAMDGMLGIIYVAKELDRTQVPEYLLVVKATDRGMPALSSTCRVRILVTVSDNAPPKFEHSKYEAEIEENKKAGSHVTAVSAISRSSIVYEIISGNTKTFFQINSNSGVITTTFPLDYEQFPYYNLTIQATNIILAKAITHVVVHVSDVNDNSPEFLFAEYVGHVMESAPPVTVVLDNTSQPLVVRATDRDSNLNAMLRYQIVELEIRKYFSIDPNTGALKTVQSLDHEWVPIFEFTVQAHDLGKPQLSTKNPAKVTIIVDDINDSSPVFTQNKYEAIILLPTYRNVLVAKVTAYDPDTDASDELHYSILHGNDEGLFSLSPTDGSIYVKNNEKLGGSYHLTIRASDGVHSSTALMTITTKMTKVDGLAFVKGRHKIEVVENVTNFEKAVFILEVTGHSLNEHIVFTILNPSTMFFVGRTSGAFYLNSTFDREECSSYDVIVECRDERELPRVARTVVHVDVIDVNDNAPIFINQPYVAMVPIDLEPGKMITKVAAIDRDIGSNAEIVFSINNNEDKFEIDARTGELSLKRGLHDSEQGFSKILNITATDKGDPPLSTTVAMPVQLMSRTMPFFERQFYEATIPENIQLHTAVISIQATSPSGSKLIYSLTQGDIYHEFAVDFNLGVISVVDDLDYEMQQNYQLTLRATDTLSSVHSDVIVNVQLVDVNDNAPIFEKSNYIFNVLEVAPVGTSIGQVKANDEDSGANKLLHYHIEPVEDGDITLSVFHVDSSTGSIHTKQNLDYEKQSHYRFHVVAMDSGNPALSSTTTVWIRITDINDNPPFFDQYNYNCSISEEAAHGQFVTMVTAFDPDHSDWTKLKYFIVGGNEQKTFSVDSKTGAISLASHGEILLEPFYILNITATDGVYSAFTQVHVNVTSANKFSPVFTQNLYEVNFTENKVAGSIVTTVVATDRDRDTYGKISFRILDDKIEKVFDIDENTGEIRSKVALDREECSVYVFSVIAEDGGGRSGFATVSVHIGDKFDSPPVFRASQYRANIHSDTDIGTSILKVKAVDPDAGNGIVHYSIYESEMTNASNLFTINKTTGDLTISSLLTGLENEVVQFFIRAEDGGMAADVPIEVMIMDDDDVPPRFEQGPYQYFVNENIRPGSPIATIPAKGETSLSYSIVPGVEPITNSKLQFSIDNDGTIRVLRPLDREETDQYVLTIEVSTLSSPPLTDFTEVHIQIMDVNDNYPEFSCSPCEANVAENVPRGTPVIQMTAIDADLSTSGVSYSIVNEAEVSGFFIIDSKTGWVTTVAELDREAVMSYVITVKATDGGEPIQLAQTTELLVNVMDYNDNPPTFSKSHYTAAVNEDALPGTTVMVLETTDLDEGENAMASYYIIAGDQRGQFDMGPGGEVYVTKPLDREMQNRYDLLVLATDGLFVTQTQLTVEILDVNDNVPMCDQDVYSEIISEGSTVTQYVTRIQAIDNDFGINARLKYNLTGPGSNMFDIHPHMGIITVARQLDRESVSKYELVAVAADVADHSCTSRVEIKLSDVNDNAPQFDSDHYTVTVAEDMPRNSLLIRVHATDPDLGINRQINYTLEDSADGTFSIDATSGIVSLTKPLDREVQSSFNLHLRATDHGQPRLFGTATLTILVSDVNDNPPEFERKVYTASVGENTPIDNNILRVLATSRDSGINAQITYSIIAGNEHNKFSIDPKTGAISVVKPLDYEVSKDYFLTIQANDGGTPSLSNIATVNINITDYNDNAPSFSQPSYSAQIKENADLGTSVIQLLATDEDSSLNGLIAYSIMSGDAIGMFDIDGSTGVITVAKHLDRETRDSYTLQVHATDSGKPPLSSFVHVNIELLDANDNPPKFSETNYSVIVQEDRPIGLSLMRFTVTDDDVTPNADPFTFDIISGNDAHEFRMVPEGTLRTAMKFDYKIRSQYTLQVRVFDNGVPPLFSDTWVKVNVIEESQYPPVVSGLRASVNSYLDEFPGGIVGKVKATDADVYDTLSYQVLPPYGHVFDIDNAGYIKAHKGLDVGEYKVNVSVSDGKYVSYGEVYITVILISEDMLQHSVSIQIADVTPEQFLLAHKQHFIRAVRNELMVRSRDVYIVSIQQTALSSGRFKRKTSDLDVLFAVRRKENSFYKPIVLRRKLNADALRTMEESMGIDIIGLVPEICNADTCHQGMCREKLMLDELEVVSVVTPSTSFVSPVHKRDHDCYCLEGYGGEKCELEINECSRQPCPSYKICVPVMSAVGYMCVCQDGKTGPTCEQDVDKNCIDDHCLEKKKPMSLNGTSYLRYTLVNLIDRRLSLSLSVRTIADSGNLMYTSGRVDYSILEIVNGLVQYRFDCGSGEGLVRVNHIYVNDGQWHEITVDRNQKQAELIVDGKFSALGSVPGTNDVLNLNSHDVFFGAEVAELSGGRTSVTKGFKGCLADLKIDKINLPRAGANKVGEVRRLVNISFQCQRTLVLGVCGQRPCLNGGTCVETGPNHFHCECIEPRFKGEYCELDTDPCASYPCHNGGTCHNLSNDYTCECPRRMTGKQCDYGFYCQPNPCHNSMPCTEGPVGPKCVCTGFEGPVCQYDIDECVRNPCLNGGTCENTHGSYKCHCDHYMTGINCENFTSIPKITAAGVNHWTYVGPIIAVAVIVILALVFVIYRVCRHRRKSQDINNSEGLAMNVFDNERVPSKPNVPPRPLSYVKQQPTLNNINQGYATKEENRRLDRNFVQNKNVYCAREPESLRQPLLGQTPNIPVDPGKCWDAGKRRNQPTSIALAIATPPRSRSQIGTPVPASGLPAVSEEDLPVVQLRGPGGIPYCRKNILYPLNNFEKEGYYWDASDWAYGSNLGKLSEVSMKELPDCNTSSLHSNESNTHACVEEQPKEMQPFLSEQEDEVSYPDMIDDESEYVGDSEFADNEFEFDDDNLLDYQNNLPQPDIGALIAGLNYADEDDGTVEQRNYDRHPNQYLPDHNYDVGDDLLEQNSNQNNIVAGEAPPPPPPRSPPPEDDCVPCNEPNARNSLQMDSEYNSEAASAISGLDDMSVSVGGYTSTNASYTESDCNLTDDDAELHVLALRIKNGAVHTQV